MVSAPVVRLMAAMSASAEPIDQVGEIDGPATPQVAVKVTLFPALSLVSGESWLTVIVVTLGEIVGVRHAPPPRPPVGLSDRVVGVAAKPGGTVMPFGVSA